jgi:hypothetical protein
MARSITLDWATIKYVKSLSSDSVYKNDRAYLMGAFRRIVEMDMNSNNQYPDRSIDQ